MKIKAMMDAGGTRLILNLGELRDHDKPLTTRLLKTPLEIIPILEAAVKDVRRGGRARRLCEESGCGCAVRSE